MIVRLTGVLLIVRFLAPIIVAVIAYVTLSQFLNDVATIMNTHRPVIEQDLSAIRADLSTIQGEFDNLKADADTVIVFIGDLTENITLPNVPTSLDFSNLTLPPFLAAAAQFRVFNVSIRSILEGIDVPLPFAQPINTTLSSLRSTFGTITAPYDNLSLVSASLGRISENTNDVWLSIIAMMNDFDTLMVSEPTKTEPNPGGWALRLQNLLLMIMGVFVMVYVSFVLDSLLRGWKMLWRGEI